LAISISYQHNFLAAYESTFWLPRSSPSVPLMSSTFLNTTPNIV